MWSIIQTIHTKIPPFYIIQLQSSIDIHSIRRRRRKYGVSLLSLREFDREKKTNLPVQGKRKSRDFYGVLREVELSNRKPKIRWKGFVWKVGFCFARKLRTYPLDFFSSRFLPSPLYLHGLGSLLASRREVSMQLGWVRLDIGPTNKASSSCMSPTRTQSAWNCNCLARVVIHSKP